MNTESFSWNLVTKNVEDQPLLQKKLRQKISKLEKHLTHFPPDAVHLQIVLERHPKKPLYTAALTLRVPSHILHSEKSASSIIEAFDEATKALLRELEGLKADLRRERFWKRKARREHLRELKSAAFAAEPQTKVSGPQKFEEAVRDLFKQHYNTLLGHARRDIRHDELTGDLPLHALDAREIIDEVARQAETKASRKPPRMSWLVWFYHLLHEELHRQRIMFKRKQAEEVSIEEFKTLPENSEAALQPLELMVKKKMEPEITRVEDLIPDPTVAPPDQVVEQNDLLESLQERIQSWPRPQRDVFELHFVQGFEPDEIAMITGQPLKTLQDQIATIQSRLREEMRQEEAA